MNRKELTKTFIIISPIEKKLVFMVYKKKYQQPWTRPCHKGVGRVLLYSVYMGKSAFCKIAVTENDFDSKPKVQKMFITF